MRVRKFVERNDTVLVQRNVVSGGRIVANYLLPAIPYKSSNNKYLQTLTMDLNFWVFAGLIKYKILNLFLQIVEFRLAANQTKSTKEKVFQFLDKIPLQNNSPDSV